MIHQLRKEDPENHSRPQLNVATQDARWFLLCNVDGVTVTTADGRGVVYRQRDRAKMFGLRQAHRCAGTWSWRAGTTTCEGSTVRGTAGAVQQAEVGDRPAGRRVSGSRQIPGSECLARNRLPARRPVRSRHWSQCSPSWLRRRS